MGQGLKLEDVARIVKTDPVAIEEIRVTEQLRAIRGLANNDPLTTIRALKSLSLIPGAIEEITPTLQQVAQLNLANARDGRELMDRRFVDAEEISLPSRTK